jgi:DNA (cytosine-5)-methyltransferase 1
MKENLMQMLQLEKVIPNHLTARLSAIDMKMVESIPQGGNWKNIPLSIPSKRLEQIRLGFDQGKGSRSTYYGRLRPDMPSYTINTYFNRPGNGCHIHYSQDRVISQREAARLQTFQDNFVFFGSQNAVNTQIGNAVPPLLAYQIAKTLGEPGIFVDLFSGAGGLGLGFKWAGWQPIVANDIEERFLQTYAQNVHHSVVPGSITDPEVYKKILDIAQVARKKSGCVPFWVLGGPPCQGFSTAGHRRTMEDQRNHLFWDYKRFLEALKPDGFVFENVTGLMNMQGGKVFAIVKEAFQSVMPSIQGWLLATEEYAIPQRRKRVVLVGSKKKNFEVFPPKRLTTCLPTYELFSDLQPAVSVAEAISDLPPLIHGQDGSELQYLGEPSTAFQSFMRGSLTAKDYLFRIANGLR